MTEPLPDGRGSIVSLFEARTIKREFCLSVTIFDDERDLKLLLRTDPAS